MTLHLLLVEDSPRDATLVTRQLRQAAYEVAFERVETAEQMERALDLQTWDLVIADYSMPAFGAQAALALLRQRALDLPLIIVSGTISDEVAVECMKQGAADYLIKDRLGRLGEAVRGALEEQRLRAVQRHTTHQIRFQARLLEAVEQAVMAVDLEGKITYWNHYAERLYGWSAVEVHKRDLLDVLPAATSRQQMDTILSDLRRGISWSGELTLSCRDGNCFPALITGSPLYDDQGNLCGMVGVSIDITDRKRQQLEEERARKAAEALAQMRSDLVAAVSHELRTPLTAIIGYAELLLSRWQVLDEPGRLNKITQIVAAANREYRLVADLLLLSKLDTDVLVAACRPTTLLPLIKMAAAEVQGSYPEQQITMHGPANLEVLADPDRTLQVLTNLLDNAAKYSPEGSPIEVGWCVEGATVVLRVGDRGPGIPEEGHIYLFTRFGRVPGSRIRAGHVGTGLGLYLGRMIARAMGGELDMERTGPEGSTFRLRLAVTAGE